MAGTASGRINHGLAFIALLGFITAFLAARTFTTFYPHTVVVTSGIHFHHFWYGLAMVVASGWLGIAYNRPALDRVYALVFGLGGGLIGDEVGLLLTFGDYKSDLTYFFVVGVVSFVILATLAVRYGDKLEDDVTSLGAGERLAHVGVAVAALAALPLAFGFLLGGVATAIVGVGVAAYGYRAHRRSRGGL